MLSAVSSMQTEASCGRNHSKLGHLCSLFLCQLPPPSGRRPHALSLAGKKLPCPASVCEMNKPYIHTPQISAVQCLGNRGCKAVRKPWSGEMEGHFEL